MKTERNKAKVKLQTILNQKNLDSALIQLADLRKEPENEEMVNTIFKTFLDIKSLSRDGEIWHK